MILFTKTKKNESPWISIFKLFISTAIAIFAGLYIALPTHSQSETTLWESPLILSQSIDAQNVTSPKMAGDQAGNLHVIWGNWTSADLRPFPYSIDTIFYTWYSNERWSDPIDILVGMGDPTVRQIEIGNITITDDGQIIILWRSGSNLFLSRALVGQAETAANWDTQILDAGRVSYPYFVVDTNDVWHVVYTVDSVNVIITTSEDEGETWRSLNPIWGGSTESAPANLEMTATDDTLHIVWTEATSRRNWNGEAIWYARLSLPTRTVETREVARSTLPNDPNLDFPGLAVGDDGLIHLWWNNSVGSDTGRFHQWSTDYGETWSETNRVFSGELSGMTGRAGMVVDSENTLHLITSAQDRSVSTRLHYAAWKDGAWSPYTTPHQLLFGGEQPTVALTHGNQLHVLWYGQITSNIDTNFAAVYSKLYLDLPVASPVGFTVHTNNQQDDVEVITGELDEETDQLIPPNLPHELTTNLSETGETAHSPFSSLTIAVFSALALLAIVLVINVKRR